MDATTTWKTRDGRALRVGEMTDAHLMNTMRMLERVYAIGLLPYCSDIGPSGDAAQIAVDEEYSQYLDAGPVAAHPAYPAMLAEAIRRGLTSEKDRLDERTGVELAALNLNRASP